MVQLPNILNPNLKGIKAKAETLKAAKRIGIARLKNEEKQLLLMAWSLRISEKFVFERELTLDEWIAVFENRNKEVGTDGAAKVDLPALRETVSNGDRGSNPL